MKDAQVKVLADEIKEASKDNGSLIKKLRACERHTKDYARDVIEAIQKALEDLDKEGTK
jgi:hypothetical protein